MHPPPNLVRNSPDPAGLDSLSRPSHGGNIVWAAQLAKCSPQAILDFSASINPLGLPAIALATLQQHLSSLVTYPDPQYHELRQAIAAFHQVSPDWVLPGNGAAELLTWAGRELAEQSVVYLSVPAFKDYRRALLAFGATVVPVFGHFAPKVEVALPNRALAAQQAAGLLINNPHNPTGQLWSRADLLPYLEAFALVVVDEAFMDFLPEDTEQSLIPWVEQYPNLVVVRSLTKFYSLPGLRLGYAIAHPERLQRWQQWRDPWSVNTLAAAVGSAVLTDRDFQQQTWNWLAQAKPALFNGLDNLPGLHPQPGAANFLLVRADHSVCLLQEQLLKHHQILIRDCLSFAELGDRYFRVAVKTTAENQRLLDGLARIIHSAE